MLPGSSLVNNICYFLFNFSIAYHFVNFPLFGQLVLYQSNRSVQLNLLIFLLLSKFINSSLVHFTGSCPAEHSTILQYLTRLLHLSLLSFLRWKLIKSVNHSNFYLKSYFWKLLFFFIWNECFRIIQIVLKHYSTENFTSYICMGFGYLFHIKIENIVRLLLFIHKNVNEFVKLHF